MRGERFSESLAREAMASLPDKFLTTFMAMDGATRNECIAKFNGFFERSPKRHARFSILERAAE